MIKITPAQAKDKIFRYCAYQERSHLEVRNKLYSYGLFRDEVDELLTYLITEGFLNEERFARAYAGGKFRMKKWGRIKITHGLEAKGVSLNCIRLGLKEIEEGDYLESLREVLNKKSLSVEEENQFARRDKLATHAIGKGYEPDLVWSLVKSEF